MGKEVDYNAEKICEMMNTVTCWLQAEIAKGKEACNITEFKELCDGVKDLAEAKDHLKEACYFEKVTEAMEENGHADIYGYNPNHYNNGKFAPKGSGHIVYGYGTADRIPYDQEYLENPGEFRETMQRGLRNSRSYTDTNMDMNGSGRGRKYDQYAMAKRYYHNGDMTKKHEMDMYAEEYISELVLTAAEMYNTADTPVKNRLVKAVEGLLAQMKETK